MNQKRDNKGRFLPYADKTKKVRFSREEAARLIRDAVIFGLNNASSSGFKLPSKKADDYLELIGIVDRKI